MTVLNISTDIPSSINTLEKLAAWVGLALERCNPSAKILESPNSQPQRVAEAVLIRADDSTHRMIIRLSIPISDTYADNPTVKFWQNALEIGSNALPTAYKTNSAPSIISAPPSGHIKWYRADGVTLNGNNVISVLDKSTGNNLTPISGNVTLVDNAINGKPALKFTNAALKSSGETYKLSHLFIIYRNNFITFTDNEAYISYRNSFSDKVPVSNESFSINGITSLNKIFENTNRSTKVFTDKIAQSINDYQDSTVGLSTGVVGQFHILENVLNSVSGAKNLCVGADAYLPSARFLQNVDIAEILGYPDELTETQRTELYIYFKQNYAFSFL